MKILVCDDEQAVCTELVQLLLGYAGEKGIAIEAEAVYSGMDAERRLKSVEYDLLFLDIEMKNMDGVSLGCRIRDEYKNYTLQIIFISAKQNYAMQLFQVRPFDFMIKPVTKEYLFHKMDLFMRIYRSLEALFTYHKKGSIHQCKVKNILYFESTGKKVIIHLTDRNDEFYAPLKEISRSLEGQKFFCCHKSYLVQFENVRDFYPDHLILVNGERLGISQSKRRHVREIIKNWGMG